jgi:AraC-like DNA-binding protein
MQRGDSAMTATPGVLTATPDLRLEGAIFLRGEYTEGWAYESPDGSMMAGLLRPGSERLIFFHLVAQGRCWIAVAGGDRHWASGGDVIVIPYGDQHCMGGSDDAEVVSMDAIMDDPPWETLPVVRHGEGGDRTDIVCGYLHCDDPLFNPSMRALPPVFVVRPPPGTLADWVRASITYALEASAGNTDDSPLAMRLPELLLMEVLRLHLATAPATDRGWVAALRDPVLGPAMALMHRAPERRWTVADLAAEVATSRSVLDDRFRRTLGRSPIRYLTEWRMHVAEELLATTDVGVGAVSRRVGYDSEEAFSRAFKRAHGQSPSHWRTSRSASPAAATG